jgi:hypothetical protein
MERPSTAARQAAASPILVPAPVGAARPTLRALPSDGDPHFRYGVPSPCAPLLLCWRMLCHASVYYSTNAVLAHAVRPSVGHCAPRCRRRNSSMHALLANAYAEELRPCERDAASSPVRDRGPTVAAA